MEKDLAHLFKYDLVQLRGNSCSSTSLKKSQVRSAKSRDKLQFVNSVKRLVFDLRKIPFLKCLISIYRLIVEVLNVQNLFTELNLGNSFSSSCSCRTQATVEKDLAHLFKYDLVQLRGNSCSSTSLKKSQVRSAKSRDKLQFVNSVKRLVFDLRKIPFLKCLISI